MQNCVIRTLLDGRTVQLIREASPVIQIRGGDLKSNIKAAEAICRTNQQHVNDREKVLLITSPHNAQALCHITDTDTRMSEPDTLCSESLVSLSCSDSTDQVVMTGEEMDDLCTKWLILRKRLDVNKEMQSFIKSVVRSVKQCSEGNMDDLWTDQIISRGQILLEKTSKPK